MSHYPWTDLHGTLSFSLLKTIDVERGGSPAHFRANCTTKREGTASMRVGTCAHWYALGGPPEREPLVYRGDKVRDPKSWKAFKEQYAGREIIGQDEDGQGRAIADALLAAPHNLAIYDRWIAIRAGGWTGYESPFYWEMEGFPFSTRGVDVLHVVDGTATVVDLKTCQDARPARLRYVCRDLSYFEQLACYAQAVRSSRELIGPVLAGLVFVETRAPYVAHAVRVGPLVLEEAMSRVHRWLLTLRTCLDTDTWPGYGEESEAEPDAGSLDGLESVVEHG